MGQVIVNGNIMGESNETIVITPEYTEGIKIATIQIGDNEPVEIYIPQGGNS